MSNPVGKGTILIKDSADLPEILRHESTSYSNGWRVFRNLDRYGLDRCVSQARWNLFFMAGSITASAIGRDEEKTTHRAIRNLTKDPELRACNCIEISRVSVRNFIGIPYVNVAGNVVQIQKSESLPRPKQITDPRPGYASG